MTANKKFKILIVDDEKLAMEPLLDRLGYEGYDEQVIFANSCSDALEILKTEFQNIRVAIIDCVLPIGKNTSFLEKQFQNGKVVGLELAKYIKSNFHHIKIAGYSILNEPDIFDEYFKNKIHYISKLDGNAINNVFHFIKHEILHYESQMRFEPNIFIVHGHEEKKLLELKNYIQNTLKLGQPIVLKEKPSEGNTIIEKFEKYSWNINLVFVLLTPDDFVTVQENNKTYFQARPNVIFELGYFAGKLKRKSGKIILLVQSPTNMFSDYAGVVYIDVSNGIFEAGEQIRNELADWL